MVQKQCVTRATQTAVGTAGKVGATVRRQSIASTKRASCAGVSCRLPSTIGGHRGPAGLRSDLWKRRGQQAAEGEAALLQPLGEEAKARAVPVEDLQIIAPLTAEDEEMPRREQC